MKTYKIIFHMAHHICAAWVDYCPDNYEPVCNDYGEHKKIYDSLQKLGFHNFWHMTLEDNLPLEEAQEKCRILNEKYNCYDKDIGLLDAGEEVFIDV